MYHSDCRVERVERAGTVAIVYARKLTDCVGTYRCVAFTLPRTSELVLLGLATPWQ